MGKIKEMTEEEFLKEQREWEEYNASLTDEDIEEMQEDEAWFHVDSKLKRIVDVLNNHEYDDIAVYLQETRWDNIEDRSILPKMALRRFTWKIKDRQIRRIVMHYLLDNADYYFRDTAAKMINNIYNLSTNPVSKDVIINETDKLINEFKGELTSQLRQIENFGDSDVVVINRLQEKNRNLEKQVAEQQEEIAKLRKKVNYYEHPEDFNKKIPKELNCTIFLAAVEYLITIDMVFPIGLQNIRGIRAATCYSWRGPKGLFGYFVDRMNEELGLRKEGCELQWQPFKKAFVNYDKIIKEARNTVSRYTQTTAIGAKNRMSKALPKTAADVDKAIKYAREKKNNS